MRSMITKRNQSISSCYRLGEYTRGMCVVDNRETPTGLNEAGDLQSRDKLLKEIEHSEKSSSAEDTNNIFVLTATPGSEALVDAIFEHVWGVQRHKTWYTRLSEMFSRFVDTITKD